MLARYYIIYTDSRVLFVSLERNTPSSFAVADRSERVKLIARKQAQLVAARHRERRQQELFEVFRVTFSADANTVARPFYDSLCCRAHVLLFGRTLYAPVLFYYLSRSTTRL